jgi:hypothetical protein
MRKNGHAPAKGGSSKSYFQNRFALRFFGFWLLMMSYGADGTDEDF